MGTTNSLRNANLMYNEKIRNVSKKSTKEINITVNVYHKFATV